MNAHAQEHVIVFDNLMQRSATVGEYQPVQAKAKSFVSSNAHGILRKVTDLNEVSEIAAAAGRATAALIKSK